MDPLRTWQSWTRLFTGSLSLLLSPSCSFWLSYLISPRRVHLSYVNRPQYTQTCMVWLLLGPLQCGPWIPFDPARDSVASFHPSRADDTGRVLLSSFEHGQQCPTGLHDHPTRGHIITLGASRRAFGSPLRCCSGSRTEFLWGFHSVHPYMTLRVSILFIFFFF